MCFRYEHTPTCALSLQFCTELNQPLLPNIRKWKQPRGCWKAVVAEMPSTPLQKVPSSAKLGFYLRFVETFLFPNHRHLKLSFANIPGAILCCCTFLSSLLFVAKCPGSSCFDQEWTAAQAETGVWGDGRRGEILSGAKAANGVFLSFVLLILSPQFYPLPSLWRAHCSLTENFKFT